MRRLLLGLMLTLIAFRSSADSYFPTPLRMATIASTHVFSATSAIGEDQLGSMLVVAEVFKGNLQPREILGGAKYQWALDTPGLWLFFLKADFELLRRPVYCGPGVVFEPWDFGELQRKPMYLDALWEDIRSQCDPGKEVERLLELERYVHAGGGNPGFYRPYALYRSASKDRTEGDGNRQHSGPPE